LRDEVGAENFFLFGLTESEVEKVKSGGYRPADYIDSNDEPRTVLDLIAGGAFSHGDTEVFRSLASVTTTRSWYAPTSRPTWPPRSRWARRGWTRMRGPRCPS
jgi:glucan phosphorylase